MDPTWNREVRHGVTWPTGLADPSPMPTTQLSTLLPPRQAERGEKEKEKGEHIESDLIRNRPSPSEPALNDRSEGPLTVAQTDVPQAKNVRESAGHAHPQKRTRAREPKRTVKGFSFEKERTSKEGNPK